MAVTPHTKNDRYNVIIVGGGAAGLVSSYIAATVKAKTALIERHKMGGDCLYTGCIPSKSLISTAKLVHDIKHAKEHGISDVSFHFDFAQTMERIQKAIRKIEPNDSIERYSKLGVECFTGHGEIIDAHHVVVNGKKLFSRNLILALGASPKIPSLPGLEDISFVTSETIWKLRTLPKKLLVLGAGPIGIEMAQAFQRLGSQVFVVDTGTCILPKEDRVVSTFIKDRLENEGVTFYLGFKPVRAFSQDNTHKLVGEHVNQTVTLDFDQMLIAVGRSPNTSGEDAPDWQKLGISLNSEGHVVVDRFMRANGRNIYACGDVTGPFQFTHAASHQAWYCAVNALFHPFKKFAVDYSVMPWVTYCDPEVAHVGAHEYELEARGIPYDTTDYEMDHSDRAITEGSHYGFVRVLTSKRNDRILGATITARHAGEMLTEFVTAMKQKRGLNSILSTIHSYPTWSEANKMVAGNWRKKHVPEWGLKLLRLYHDWRR